MMDHKGDPSKQPPECKPVFTPFSETNPRSPYDYPWAEGKWSRCPNLDMSYSDMSGETYSCEVCGKYYKLYYEDMA